MNILKCDICGKVPADVVTRSRFKERAMGPAGSSDNFYFRYDACDNCQVELLEKTIVNILGQYPDFVLTAESFCEELMKVVPDNVRLQN